MLLLLSFTTIPLAHATDPAAKSPSALTGGTAGASAGSGNSNNKGSNNGSGNLSNNNVPVNSGNTVVICIASTCK